MSNRARRKALHTNYLQGLRDEARRAQIDLQNTIDYRAMVPNLLFQVEEQAKVIEALKAERAELRRLLDAMAKRLATRLYVRSITTAASPSSSKSR